MSRVPVRVREVFLRRVTHVPSCENEPDWYRGNYLIAVALANVAQTRKQQLRDIPENLRDAQTQAKDQARAVADSLESKLIELEGRRLRRRQDRAFVEFLKALEPIVLLLLAGTLRRWEPGADASPELASKELDRRSLVAALRRKDLLAADIIGYVRHLRLDYRARYNLACYYAGIGDKEADARRAEAKEELVETEAGKPEPEYTPPREHLHAFSELAEALKTAPVDLIKWAADDPSLASLRKDKLLGPRLKKLSKELTTEKEPPRKIPGKVMNTRAQ